jgi:hypothetical protein
MASAGLHRGVMDPLVGQCKCPPMYEGILGVSETQYGSWRIRLGRSTLVAVNEGSVELRRAMIDDLERLRAIDDRAAAGDAERISAISTHVSGGSCWVASGETDFDGYAVLLPRHFFGRDFLELLMVSSLARRSGVGTGILRALLRMDGTNQVFSSTNRSNAPMRELLSKEGWRFSGELVGLDPDDPEMIYFSWRS